MSSLWPINNHSVVFTSITKRPCKSCNSASTFPSCYCFSFDLCAPVRNGPPTIELSLADYNLLLLQRSEYRIIFVHLIESCLGFAGIPRPKSTAAIKSPAVLQNTVVTETQCINKVM